MNLVKTERFEHGGKSYEIRLYGSGWDFTVKPYLNDELANGYSYSVSLPTAIDLNTVWKLAAVQLLVQRAKHDIADGTWAKHVEAHVASLKKTAEESLGCRKCGSREITATIVDQRKMYECGGCGSVWYAPRKTTNGPLTIVDEITEGVEESGSHKAHASILLNMVFRDGSFEDELRNWANQNKLKYETSGGMVRFWR